MRSGLVTLLVVLGALALFAGALWYNSTGTTDQIGRAHV
jgi:hypothetical protein